MPALDGQIPSHEVKGGLRSAQIPRIPLQSGLSLDRLERLVSVGIELSSQRDLGELLNRILEAAQVLTNSDGGTIYLIRAQKLEFAIIRNISLGIHQGGRGGDALAHSPIPMYLPDGSPNLSTVSASAAISGKTINIADAYDASEFDFSGTRRFDALNGYRSRSFLTVPMKDHEERVIGVLQLINALEPDAGGIIPFDRDDQYLVESLASQAAVVLTNRQLIERLEELFVSFIKLISNALDEKSPYTHGHCQRVPEITMLLADAAHRTDQGPLKDFTLSSKDRRELEIAALMHDCGKITTPVHVVDKSTKLETIFDRIHLIDARIEVLKRDARIRMLEARLNAPETADAAALQAGFERECRVLDEARDFLRQANVGGEFMSPEMQARVRSIGGGYRWTDPSGQQAPLLSEEEIDKLCIAKGTLSAEERDIINYHIVSTINMLEALPWPRHLRNVPEFAGGHHERMDGKGYPKGLTRDQMSVQARIMGIADIFEALTASDRPYKPGMSLSRSLAILGRMKLDNHIDPDLFDVFVREKVYLEYARAHLKPEQIDSVDESAIPGYTGAAPQTETSLNKLESEQP
ncbi:MAG: phosphohydrolase [Hydrogenophilales bacterium 28-61-23]|nr:MAG: phosphohydrolase [Hydrogenophilales bacterium 28-61-23]